MSLKICQILYLAGALVHFVEDMQFRIKKKLTLLTRNHAQYLDLFSFLNDCHFLLKCLLIFLQVVSQVWSVVGMQIPFGRNYWSRLVLLPRYKRVRTPPICWSPRGYSPVIETQPSKAIKGNKMYPHKNYPFFVIVSVVPLKKKTNKREFFDSLDIAKCKL